MTKKGSKNDQKRVKKWPKNGQLPKNPEKRAEKGRFLRRLWGSADVPAPHSHNDPKQALFAPPKNTPKKGSKKGQKRAKNTPKTPQKRPKNDPKMTRKIPQKTTYHKNRKTRKIELSCPKKGSKKRLKNDQKMVKKHPKNGQKMTKKGSKTPQNRRKSRKIPRKTPLFRAVWGAGIPRFLGSKKGQNPVPPKIPKITPFFDPSDVPESHAFFDQKRVRKTPPGKKVRAKFRKSGKKVEISEVFPHPPPWTKHGATYPQFWGVWGVCAGCAAYTPRLY